MKFTKKILLWELLVITVLFIIIYILPQKDSLLFSLSPQATVDPDNISEVFDPSEKWGIFDNQKVSVPSTAQLAYENLILGAESDKRIEVDLTNQRLYAYEGGNRVFDFLISSGKWGRTPTGSFTVWTKVRATRMQGGSTALGTYYNLPNVPYVMFFSNNQVAKSRGFSTHGTYWHNNFGHPMSHGCVNMRISDAKMLYEWASVGIPIVIYGTTPTT